MHNQILFGNNITNLIKNIRMTNSNYATQPTVQLVSSENYINNTKDYLDYLQFFILKGKRKNAQEKSVKNINYIVQRFAQQGNSTCIKIRRTT